MKLLALVSFALMSVAAAAEGAAKPAAAAPIATTTAQVQVDGLENSIKSLTSDIKAIGAEVAQAVTSGVAPLSSKVESAVSQQSEATSQVVDAINSVNTGLSGSLAAQQDAILSAIAASASASSASASASSATDSSLATILAQINSIHGKQSELEAKLDSVQSSLGVLANSMKEASDRADQKLMAVITECSDNAKATQAAVEKLLQQSGSSMFSNLSTQFTDMINNVKQTVADNEHLQAIVDRAGDREANLEAMKKLSNEAVHHGKQALKQYQTIVEENLGNVEQIPKEHVATVSLIVVIASVSLASLLSLCLSKCICRKLFCGCRKSRKRKFE